MTQKALSKIKQLKDEGMEKLRKVFFNKHFIKATCLLFLFLSAESAYAGLPWETGLELFAQSLCGPTARAVGVLAFAIAGIAIALGEVKGWIHTIMMVMIGISIAILSPSILGLIGSASSVACG